MYSGALRRIVLAGALALLALAPGVLVSGEAKAGGPAVEQDYFDIDQFYDELAPFGEWVEHPNHGYVWLPRTVAPDWRPYTVGNWVSTEEYGWYWDSQEPFAWAVYHYGRWGFEPDYGWYWVPGDTWAPAWVQWRYGDEYVGWAPEVPTAGYAYGGPARYAPPPPRESWVFVEPRYLVSPAVRSYAVPRASLTIVFNRTTYVSRPRYRNGYLYNHGMPRDHWSRVTRRHIEPRKVYRGHQRARPNGWNRRGSRDLYAYAPSVRKGAHPRKPPRKIAHKPTRAKANANSARARAAQQNRNARVQPRVMGPRGVMNPNYRGPAVRDGRRSGVANQGPGRRPQHAIPASAQSKDAKSKAEKSNAARYNAARAKAARDRAARVRADRAKAAQSNRGRPGPAQAQGQRNRAMGLAPPTRAARPGAMSPNMRGPNAGPHNRGPSLEGRNGPKPPQARRTPPKPGGDKAKAGNTRAGKPHDGKSKASGSKPRGQPSVNAHQPKPKARSANVRPSQARPARAKPQSARGKLKSDPPKSAVHRAAKPKQAKSRAAHVKPKPAKARSAQGAGNGNRKRGASGHGGGDRAKACKANPNRPGCGRRG